MINGRVYRAQSDFTLVELLVVVAVIAVLAGFLMPAMKGAVLSARSIQCISQMKQIGLTFQQYVEDNRGWLPPFRGSMLRTATASTEYWPVFLSARYLDTSFNNGRTSKLFLCPGDPQPYGHDAAGNPVAYDWYNRGYTGMGSYGANDKCLPGWLEGYCRLSKFKSNTILMSDNTYFKLVLSMTHYAFPQEFWHKGMMNVLFVDTSARPFSQAALSQQTPLP